jgi:large subunit ribosomal protein L6
MSRVAKNPVVLPEGIEAKLDGQRVTVKGKQGELSHEIHESVEVSEDNGALRFAARNESKEAHALAGTMRAVVDNMVTGIATGFEKKLVISGVGYRAQMQGKVLNLTLGYSHPIDYQVPEGIAIETPSQTEVVVKGVDKQKVGQVAAEIRAFRGPEPYKGKGVAYADERIRRKEAKKT